MDCRPILLLLLLSGSLLGCGPSVGTVTGEVTIDGKPMESGVISFVPADSNGEPVTVDVKGGKYSLEAVAGEKKVQISAPVIVGKQKEYDGPDAPLMEITQESLPPKYHSATELTFEVKPGSNTKNWQLSTERGKRK